MIPYGQMAGPVAYDPAAVQRLCGEENAAYAARKQRGGRASQAGWRFEVLYAAYRIAAEARTAYRSGDAGHDTWLQDQVGGFVDDLAVVVGERVVLSQAKSGHVGWTGGARPLADDFRLQRQLDDGLGRSPAYELVVGTDTAREALAAARPPDLGCVDVVAFRAAGADVQALLENHPELAEALDAISLREPRRIVREQTFQAVLGAWVHSEGSVRLSDLLGQLAARPDALVRVPGPDYVLPEEVARQLESVRGFAWEVVGRHLRYSVGGGRLAGWGAQLCGTPDFERFERFVIDERPTRWVEVVQELRREA